jgi:uncharacterized membrane protein (DUF4010 family)
LLDGIAFAIAAAVVLPLLPDRPLDPFGLVNPFTLWRLVVVVMGVSSIGYIARRMVGARFGLVIAGLATGLVSATAAVAAMAHRARTGASSAVESAGGAMASLLSSLGYLTAVIAAVNPRLLPALAPPFGVAMAILLGYAALLGRRATKTEPDGKAGRAFNVTATVVFVLIVAGFTLVSRVLSHAFGAAGALVGAGAAGLADAHAAAVSMATLNNSAQLDSRTATLGVLVGLTTNLLVKAPVAFFAGTRAFAIRVSLGLALMLAGLWATYGLTHLLA